MPKHTEPSLRSFSPRVDPQVRSGERVPTLFWSTDADLRVTSIQGTGLALLRLSAEALNGANLSEYLQRENPDRRLLEAHLRALQGEPSSLEATWGDRTFDAHVEPLCAADGSIVGTIGVARELTERKRAAHVRTDEALRQAEAKYRSIVENAVEGIFQTTPEGGYVSVNPALARMYGYSSPEQLMNSVSDIGHQVYVDPGRRAEFKRLMEQHDVVREFQYQVYRRDGKRIWLSECARAVRDASGAILYYEGTVEDITERKRAEIERQAISEIIHGVNVTPNLDELLRLVHQALGKVLYAENCFVALHDPNSGMFHFPFFVDRFDSAPPPVKMGRSCAAYVFRTGRPVLITRPVFERLARQGEVELVGTPSPIWLGVPLRTPSQTIGVLVVQHYEDAGAYAERDLEFLASVGGQIALAIERKLVEEALRRSEANYRSLVHGAPYGICRVSTHGKLLDVNPALVEMLGYDSEAELKAVNMDVKVYRDPDERARLLRNRPERFEGAEVVWKRKNDTLINVRLSGRLVHDPGGATDYYEMIAENITERRALENQLRQAQKMEAVGRLAGGVAHDFNNLLMVIKGHAELLLERLHGDDWQCHKAEQIQKAADRAAALTRQLLAFSRMQVLQPKVIDLNAVVTEMGKMLPVMIGEAIELSIVTSPELGRVKADPGQMEQVILNLAVNARDAMPNGGKLVIETQNCEMDEPFARRHPPMVAGRFVMLAVTDTGTGMDAETQTHIFEPFFTTKEKGKGTGLGLATVYGVVKQSGGFIWVYSEPGQGTTFKIYLPRLNDAADSPRAERVPAEAPEGSETILLVEDERDVREVARELLGMSGYTVLEAKNGAEAIEAAMRHSGPIHLLVTDMVMPGMGGPELAARLASLRPEMKVVYMSGYTEYRSARQGDLDENAVLLTKPFTRSMLARTVREALQRGKPL